MSAQFIVKDRNLPIRFVSVDDGRSIYYADFENPSVFGSEARAWERVREFRLNPDFVTVTNLTQRRKVAKAQG